MRLFSLVFILFMVGCTMGGKVQNEGTLAQQVKSDTSAALMGVESYKGPTPNSVTYNVRVGKGATCTVPAPAAMDCGNVAVERRIEKDLSEQTKAKAKGWNKITEADGFYYLLIAVAIALVAAAGIAYKVAQGPGSALFAEFEGMVTNGLKYATANTPEWLAWDKAKAKLEKYRFKIKR